MSKSRESKTDRETSGLKGTRGAWQANSILDPGPENFIYFSNRLC